MTTEPKAMTREDLLARIAWAAREGQPALHLQRRGLRDLPPEIGQLASLRFLDLRGNQLAALPDSLGQLIRLQELDLSHNQLSALPWSLAHLSRLEKLELGGNPLNPALQSAYNAGLDSLRAYLRSLEDEARRQPLYEAKLLLVGEGGVGKTTLLKALTGQAPREGEPTTHGVKIDVQALRLPHPGKPGVEIQLNTWDFGGQDVYRVTHQFFFSRRSIYLLVWEPRRGVLQCQVEGWLKMIRLRVGDDARVIVVSTHCRTGERIARIDQPVLRRDFPFIVGFCEVDSLVLDPATGDGVGIAALKDLIARTAADLEQMGLPFSRDWREARDELLALPEPRIAYARFAEVCARRGLDAIAAKTLAALMHDLGYIVYYGGDERLKDDVVLQPEWLTRAIGLVLEDRTTQEMDGILPDGRLSQVWRDHPFVDAPRFDPALYPFFLRLMEKFDVSYRLEDGTASLVAQHVPQVRPALPWLPEEPPAPGHRRIALVCAMDEDPPGLVPWMIVRTHDFATQVSDPGGLVHRLHWQKGMFLRHPPHGEAVLEQRGREFHVYAQAAWPEYFMNILQHTLHKLITDSWPGLKGRYRFMVPCPEQRNGGTCAGRFNIDALRQFLAEGDRTIRCQECHSRKSIAEMLFGFEDLDLREQLQRIEQRLEGLDSRIANYVMAIMHALANEAKDGPRLFTIEPMDGDWRRLVAKQYRLRLLCEAEGEPHPVTPVGEEGQGVYQFHAPHDWLIRIAPYAKFVARVLKTVLPIVSPAVDTLFGPDSAKWWGLQAPLDFMEHAAEDMLAGVDLADRTRYRQGVASEAGRSAILSEPERSGVLALHALLRQLDPNHQKIGLHRVPTYTGDYLWLCDHHYQQFQSKIPDPIPSEAPTKTQPAAPAVAD